MDQAVGEVMILVHHLLYKRSTDVLWCRVLFRRAGHWVDEAKASEAKAESASRSWVSSPGGLWPVIARMKCDPIAVSNELEYIRVWFQVGDSQEVVPSGWEVMCEGSVGCMGLCWGNSHRLDQFLAASPLYCTVLNCTVLNCTVLRCTIMLLYYVYTVLYCTILYSTILYYILYQTTCILYYTVILYCTIL